MIRNQCNILWVDEGIHTKNGEKTYATWASRMMQFSLRFWSGYLHQPKKYYNDSLIEFCSAVAENSKVSQPIRDRIAILVFWSARNTQTL